ncbi:Hypothetical predicted protein [Podarcis lilfordi]|uniref:Uncharacterized protein n=1 Tax=Podarcis lilfordi TaxID=74358 RepID=A0AA35KJB7_9SAUR|nr:Hypothetical predicted protein [Podarcis lilfordi]CAI5789212.1 Hypothetical predicted protein [Podarcis lilfordi]
MESPRVLEPFQPSEPDTWEDYVERFEFFAEAQGITDASKRRATFLSYCGPETFKLAKALLAPAKLSETSLKDILACLTSHLAPTETKMARRMEFHKRQQHAGSLYLHFWLNCGSSLSTATSKIWKRLSWIGLSVV